MKSGPFEVCVTMDDGTRYKEQQEITMNGNFPGSTSTTCFLESIEGKTFKIDTGANRLPETHDWAVKISVDGRRIKYSVIAPSRFPYSWQDFRFLENGKKLKGRLTFGSLATTGEIEEVTLSAQSLSQVGTIEVDLLRGHCGARYSRVRTSFPEASVGVALETAKKLCGSIAPTKVVEYQDPGEGREFDYTDGEAYHRFTFKYRTAPVLQLMGIVAAPQVPNDPVITKKRKHEVIVIDSSSEDEDQSEGGRGAGTGQRVNTALLMKRVKYLAQEKEKKEKAVKRERMTVPTNQVDLSTEEEE